MSGYRMDEYHRTHDFCTMGDGQDEPLETYCTKCWRVFDHYRDGKHNDWADKRCRWGRALWGLRL